MEGIASLYKAIIFLGARVSQPLCQSLKCISYNNADPSYEEGDGRGDHA